MSTEEAARSIRLGTFFMVAVMWLAFSFAVWFALRTVIVFPVIRMAHWVLTAWMPELFEAATQSYQEVKLSLYASTHAIGGLPDSQFVVDISFDALKFCYGLPIYVGLTAATALWSDRYWPKILLGLVILPVTQVFALVGNARGYKTLIIIPETQSQEKKDMLRLAGAELVQVPAAPYRNPNNYVRYSGRLAEALAELALRRKQGA